MVKNKDGLLPYINSKWTKDQNVRTKPIKLVIENIEGNLYDNGVFQEFLDMTPKAYARKNP